MALLMHNFLSNLHLNAGIHRLVDQSNQITQDPTLSTTISPFTYVIICENKLLVT